MKVTLIEYTGKGQGPRAAAELLVFTKSTRLNMSPGLMDEIRNWSDLEISKELEYMSNTIPSSWEFVDYVFLIENCTRAFTHQLVRNRQGSYAQQTMRILNVSGFTYEAGPTVKNNEEYEDMMHKINKSYASIIEDGAAIEDARGILPTNIHTNIVAKYNLRTLSEIVSKRSSPRTQGEYREFVESLADCILEVHPWAREFLRNRKHDAAKQLDSWIKSDYEGTDKMIGLLKLVDILRS